MAVLLTGSRFQVSTIAGLEAGAQIFSYAAGTLTPLSTFVSQGGAANTNPVICDANGEADVWLTAATGYRFIVKRSVANGGATISDVDNITAPITSGANAAFGDLTTTGNTILGNASTDTLNVGSGGIVKDATGLTGFGLAPTAAQGLVQLLGSATGGIKLGNVNSTYANAFDWYEEGTFTPVITGIGAPAYVTQSGAYQRSGNKVKFLMNLAWTGGTNGASIATITGLPYASTAAIHPAQILLNLNNATLTFTGIPVAYMNGSTALNIAQQLTASTIGAMLNPNAGQKDMYIAGEYFC